jgi:hypothetical protein
VGEVLCRDEGILYADVDLAQSVEPKQFHDVVGSYNRFDIFAPFEFRSRVGTLLVLVVTHLFCAVQIAKALVLRLLAPVVSRPPPMQKDGP